jgi:hypothetical protein
LPPDFGDSDFEDDWADSGVAIVVSLVKKHLLKSDNGGTTLRHIVEPCKTCNHQQYRSGKQAGPFKVFNMSAQRLLSRAPGALATSKDTRK